MKVREINPDQKAAQVLDVARSLFVERGFHNVSIPQIVEKSGVSTGAIYHYYGNKEGLAKSVHDHTLQNFQQMLLERLDSSDSVEDQLRSFATLAFEITELDPTMMEYMLLMKHDEFLTDVPPICSAEPFQIVQKVIKQGIQENVLRDVDSFLAAVAFTGVINRAIELRLKGVFRKNLRKISRELFGLAWASIA